MKMRRVSHLIGNLQLLIQHLGVCYTACFCCLLFVLEEEVTLKKEICQPKRKHSLAKSRNKIHPKQLTFNCDAQGETPLMEVIQTARGKLDLILNY